MDQRKKRVDRDALRDLRNQFYAQIDAGQLSLPEAAKKMRAISGLTQPEFAERMGVSAQVIKDIERSVGNPTIKSLNKIGEIFNLEIGFIRRSGLVK
jgi:DNA-binding XRE family transcriptional regulator